MHRAPCSSIALLLALMIGLSGCATGPSATFEQADAIVPDSPARVQRASLIRVGMHKPQVIEWLGEPKASESPSNANGMRETWTYEIIHEPNYKTIAAVMEPIAYVDPLTGVLRWIDEPVFNQQRIQNRETLLLTFRGPRLIDIERSVDRVATYRD